MDARIGWSWATVAVLVGRLIFTLMFAMAVGFKLAGPAGTAGYIASAGFPAPKVLTVLAIVFELGLVAAFLTGAYFREAALAAAAYVLFLGVAFHGPAHWAENQDEFGFFVDHFTFIAGLLFAAAHGPGDVLVWKRGYLRRTAG
jgi:putative oxidoreductase